MCVCVYVYVCTNTHMSVYIYNTGMADIIKKIPDSIYLPKSFKYTFKIG